jgi:hypothetical protein
MYATYTTLAASGDKTCGQHTSAGPSLDLCWKPTATPSYVAEETCRRLYIRGYERAQGRPRYSCCHLKLMVMPGGGVDTARARLAEALVRASGPRC